MKYARRIRVKSSDVYQMILVKFSGLIKKCNFIALQFKKNQVMNYTVFKHTCVFKCQINYRNLRVLLEIVPEF